MKTLTKSYHTRSSLSLRQWGAKTIMFTLLIMLMKCWTVISTLIWSFLPTGQAFAQQQDYLLNGMPCYQYTTRDYGGYSQNWAIVQDTVTGIIYVANGGPGMMIFDGTTWRHIPTTNNRSVFSLAIDKQGRVYAGAYGEFGYLAPDSTGSMQFVALSAPPPGKSGSTFHSDWLNDSIEVNEVWLTHVIDDKVFFNDFDHLFVYQDNSLQVIYPEKRFFKSFKAGNTLWIPEQGKGFYRWQDDSLQFVKGSEFFKDKRVFAFGKHVIYAGGTYGQAGNDMFRQAGNGMFTPLDPSSIQLGFGQEFLAATKSKGIFLFNYEEGSISDISYLQEPENSGLYSAQIFGGIALQKEPWKGNWIFNTSTNGIFITRGEKLNMPGWIEEIQQGKNVEVQQHISGKDGLQNEKVWYVYEDKGGRLWLALDNGISIIDARNPVRVLMEGEGFSGGIEDITRHNGALYITTAQGVFQFITVGEKFKIVKGIANQCYDLLSTHAGLLVGTNNGVYRVEDIKSNKVSNIQGLALCPVDLSMPSLKEYSVVKNEYNRIKDTFNETEHIRAMASLKKPADLVLAGGRNGLAVLKYKAGTWQEVKRITNLPPEIISITQELENSPGDANTKPSRSSGDEIDSLIFWLGLRTKGVIRIVFTKDLTSHQITRYDTTYGLPARAILTFRLKNRVVFGTNKGLYHLSPDHLITQSPQLNEKKKIQRGKPDHPIFTPDSSLGTMFADGTREVFRLVEDNNGNVWIQSDNRIFLCKLMTNGKYELDTIPFLSIDIGQVNAIYPDIVQPGVVWFGGKDGLARYDANLTKNYREPYRCLIRRVSVGEDSLIFGGASPLVLVEPENRRNGETEKRTQFTDSPIHRFSGSEKNGGEVILSYKDRDIRFEFSAPFFEKQEEIVYSRYLEGYDKKWSAWSKETKKEYTNLPEGGYTFRVKARNVYYHESKMAEYGFTIRPPFHRTWWFSGAQVLFVLILFVIALYAGRVRKGSGRLAQVLATMVIIILFEYAQNLAEGFFEDVTGGMLVLRVVISCVLVAVLLPMEKWIKNLIHGKRRSSA